MLSCRLDANLVIMVSTVIIPIAMFLIPFTRVLGGLALVLSVMGINMGVIDCLANLQMIQMFGERVGPFLQVCYYMHIRSVHLQSFIIQYDINIIYWWSCKMSIRRIKVQPYNMQRK